MNIRNNLIFEFAGIIGEPTKRSNDQNETKNETANNDGLSKLASGLERLIVGNVSLNQTGLTQINSSTFESDSMLKLASQVGMLVGGNVSKAPDFFRMLFDDKITKEHEDPSGMGKQLLGDAKQRGGKNSSDLFRISPDQALNLT